LFNPVAGGYQAIVAIHAGEAVMSNPDFTSDLTDFEAKLRSAFEKGRQQGQLDERERIGRLLQIGTATVGMGVDAVPPPAPAEASTTKPGGRVPMGTIRPLVREIIAAEGGLTKAEITRRVVARNSSIAAPSISNELSRNEKGGLKLYRRTRGGRWYLNDDELPETEGPAVAEDDQPAGSGLNGSHYDEGPIATSGPDQ
jgi:hypothetical protein